MNLKIKEYDIKKAASRLSWRFSKKNGESKAFTPNENDIEAVNTLLTWINKEKENSLYKNELFAKLFIYFLNNRIEKYNYDKNCHPDEFEGYISFLDTEPEKDLCRILDLPLESFYVAFFDKINKDWRDYLINKLKKNQDIKNEPLEKYTLDRVKLELNHKITEALNRFS